MRVGGRLAQFAPPAELLSRPADSFVAGFVGRDRGYRALGFAIADHLPLEHETPVRLGESVRAGRERARDDWALVVDEKDCPLGWLAVGRIPEAALDGEITEDLLNLGGTLAAEDGSLRAALDAALSSPSGRGVVVHEDGSYAGTVTASQVLSRIENRAADEREKAVEQAAVEIGGAAG
jgi:osmoprotectant transport system ATP-binding protein